MKGVKKIIKQVNTTKIIISMILISTALIFSVSSVSAADNDTIYVNDTGGNDDNNGTSWEWAKSIKNATGTVNINGTVYIADGTYTGAGNTNILIDRNMGIIGQSQTGTIINGTDSARIFNITSGITVTIANLTLTNGNEDYHSGAIYNQGTLILSGCTLNNNTATGLSTWGGAIYNDGNLTVTNSIFTGNTATGWGNGGAIYNYGNLTVTNSIFTGNTAQDDGNGGAIYNDYNSILTIIGSTFTNNTVMGSDVGVEPFTIWVI